MSALPPKADIGTQPRDVRFVPIADIARGGAPAGTGRKSGRHSPSNLASIDQGLTTVVRQQERPRGV